MTGLTWYEYFGAHAKLQKNITILTVNY